MYKNSHINLFFLLFWSSLFVLCQAFPIWIPNSNLDASENCENLLIIPNEFVLQSPIFSARYEVDLKSVDEKIVYGQFYKKIWTLLNNVYRYIDTKGNILVTIEQEVFTWEAKYTIESCKGSRYRLEEIWPPNFFSLGYQTSYKIFRDDKLIAMSNGFKLIDIHMNITDTKGIVLAQLTQKWFNYNWHVVNQKPEILDNYIVAIIGALQSLKRQESDSNLVK